MAQVGPDVVGEQVVEALLQLLAQGLLLGRVVQVHRTNLTDRQIGCTWGHHGALARTLR
jgi:hypothetical protein